VTDFFTGTAGFGGSTADSILLAPRAFREVHRLDHLQNLVGRQQVVAQIGGNDFGGHPQDFLRGDLVSSLGIHHSRQFGSSVAYISDP
jgi:hypothetical protein